LYFLRRGRHQPRDLVPDDLTSRLRASGALPCGRATTVDIGERRTTILSTIVPLRVEYSPDTPWTTSAAPRSSPEGALETRPLPTGPRASSLERTRGHRTWTPAATIGLRLFRSSTITFRMGSQRQERSEERRVGKECGSR